MTDTPAAILYIDDDAALCRLTARALQRAGYVNAFRDAEVLRAIRSGPIGRIAVTYVEWAGAGLQHVVVPWMLVEDAASGDGVSRALEFAPYDARRRTSTC